MTLPNIGMRLSDRGLKLIESFEGLELHAYQDQRGIWTIGYGHTGSEVVEGLEITQAEADSLLRTDVANAERVVNALAAQFNPDITQNEFDAMVSLTYNIGGGNFSKSSVCKFFRAGDIPNAADSFLMWNKTSGQVNPGLTRRRQAERTLFLETS